MCTGGTGRCFEAVFNQDLDSPYEVAVIDSASRDETVEQARSFRGRITRTARDQFSSRATGQPCRKTERRGVFGVSGGGWLFSYRSLVAVDGAQVHNP